MSYPTAFQDWSNLYIHILLSRYNHFLYKSFPCIFPDVPHPLYSVHHFDYTVNDKGVPCCPHDPFLPMKREGSKSHLRCGLPTIKFVCPKMKWEWNSTTKKSKRVCHCDNPCTTSSCGRMIYIYPEKIFVLTPDVFVIRKNGIPHTKYV